jgi:large subunit ribosomal protein L9
MKDAIKEVGDYTATVKLHREVSLEIPVTVTPEGGAIAPPATETVSAETSADNGDANGE